MNTKKILAIIALIVFIVAIGFAFAKINNKSVEKLEAETEVTNVTTSTQTLQANGIVRKSSEKASADTTNMIQITDNYFIEQTNDIYVNIDDYIGKTVKIEGLIYSYEDDNGDTCYAVVRNTPGCCGSDGLAGIDIRYNEDYPDLDTWVEVIGVVGTDTMYGSEIPAIQVATMTVKEEQGTTFVTN